MSNYRLQIQYEGTRYNGWQRQPDTDNTIQGKIETVLARMEPDQPYPIHLVAAGRTDAGVHALAQTAHIHLETRRSCEEIRAYLNRWLPDDIGIVSVLPADERFHARFAAVSKTYCYRIALDPALHVLERRYMTPLAEILNRLQNNPLRPAQNPPLPDADALLSTGHCDLSAMRAAAAQLTGTHDYAAFCSRRMKKSTVRTLQEIAIEELPGELRLSFTGDGFLYNMVRILTGTLLEIGFHLRTPESGAAALSAPDRSRSGFTAPARGLTLVCVRYP